MRTLALLLGITLTACGTGRTIILDIDDGGSTIADGGTVVNDDGGTGTGDGGNVLPDAGPVDTGVRVPERHRETAVACDMTRPTPIVDPAQSTPNDECKEHADCATGLNGRCVASRIGYVCTYDECFEDSDCSTVCLCEGGFRSDNNVCLRQGNCRVDADCGAGNFCSPTFDECGEFSGTTGYFCHSPQDECTDDSDCGVYPWYCRYEQAVGRWTCSDSHCAG